MGAPCCLLGASTLPRPPERICASEGASVSVDNKSAVHYKMQYNVHNKCEKKMKGQKKCLKDSTPSWVRLLSVLVLCLGIITPAYEAAPSGTPCDLVTGDASARAGAAAQVLEAEVATSPPGRNIYSAALTVRRVLRRYRGPGRLKKQDVITLTLQREEVEPCLAVASLEVGKRYFVFMNAPERKGVAPKAVAAPLPYSKRARRLIRQETCSKCAARRVKPPTVVSRLPATDSAVRGHSVNFTCVFEGMPLPSVQWYKDGVPITLEDINSNDVSSSPINTNSMRIHTRRVRSRRVIRRRRRRRRRSGSHLLPLIGSPTAHNDGSEMGLPVRHSYGRQKPYLRSSLTNTNRFNEESTTDFEINSSHGSRNRLHLRPPVSTLQQLHETDNGADDVIRHSRSRSRHRHRGPSHRTRNRHNLRRGDEHHRRVSDSNTLSHNPGDSDIGNRNVGFSQGLPTTTTTTTSTPSTTTPSRRKKHRKKKNRNRSKSGRGIRRMVSSLSIGVVENDHAGEYKCVATSGNFTAEQQIALKVIPPLEPGIIYPCPMDSFCLNGGTCMYFRFVGELVCQCVEGFKGHRCQEKEVFPTYTVDNRCRGPYSNAQSSQGVRCPRNQPLALWQLLQLSLARRQFHSKILPWRNTHLIDWSNSAPPEPYLVPGMTQPQYSLQVQRNRRLLRAILALDVGDLHPFDMQSQSMETEPSSGSLAPHTRRSGQLESYIPENLQDATTYKKEKQQFFQQSSDSKLQSEEDAFPNIFVRIGHHHSNEGNARNYSDIQKNVEHITRGMIWNTEHSSLYPSEHHREHDRLNQPHRIRHSHLHDGSEQRTWSDHVYDDIEDQRSLVDDYSDMLNDGEDSEQN